MSREVGSGVDRRLGRSMGNSKGSRFEQLMNVAVSSSLKVYGSGASEWDLNNSED